MNQKEIENLLLSIDDKIITGGVKNTEIDKMETELDIKLPESYKWFLGQYGQCGVSGTMIYGIAKNNIHRASISTKDYRDKGLPNSYCVICDVDEWVYCLDTSSMINGECPVIDWDIAKGIGIEKYLNFYHFFFTKITEEIPN